MPYANKDKRIAYAKAYNARNRRTEEEKTIQREWTRLKRLAFPEHYREIQHRYLHAPHNQATIKARQKARWANDPIGERKRRKAWAKLHPHKIKHYSKKFRELYPEKKREGAKAWYQKNRVRIIQRESKRTLARRKTDMGFRLRSVLQGRIKSALRRGRTRIRKAAKTIELLGCSIPNFQIYIESKFQPGMTWLNHGRGEGKWEIDHIMPCCIFDLTKPDHQKTCFHFSNLQPLWSVENRRKSYHVSSSLWAG